MTELKDNPLMKSIGAVFGLVVAMSAIHAYYFVPSTVEKARKEWREDIRREVRPQNEGLKEDISELRKDVHRIDQKLDRAIMELKK